MPLHLIRPSETSPFPFDRGTLLKPILPSFIEMVKFRSLSDFDTTEGTVKLVDHDGLSLSLPWILIIVSHTSNLKKQSGTDIALIPQLTDDPNDPLNWSRWKKNLAFASVSFLTLSAEWSVGGLGSAVPLLMAEFNVDLKETIDAMINWPVLLLGLGVLPTITLLSPISRRL